MESESSNFEGMLLLHLSQKVRVIRLVMNATTTEKYTFCDPIIINRVNLKIKNDKFYLTLSSVNILGTSYVNTIFFP